MTIITPTPIATLPTPPAKGQVGFNAACETYFNALVNPFTPQINSAISATNENALSAQASTIAAETAAATAAAAAAAATAAAAAAAAAAATSANVELWDAVTVYSVGVVVISPAALAAGAASVTYVCRAATGSTHIDPYSDTAHWAIFITSGGVGGAVYTTSMTLTSSSPFAISISGGSGVWLKLPDATTMQKGICYAVKNTGENDLSVLDNSGATIGFIRPNCGTIISLADNSLSIGKWVGDFEVYGLTANLTFNLSTTNSTILFSSTKIDENKDAFVYGSSGAGLYCVVYDKSTQTTSNSLLVSSSAAYARSLNVGGNFAILFGTGTDVRIMLVSPSCVLLSTATAAAASAVSSIGQIIAVGSSIAMSYLNGNGAGVVRAVSVSGTTLTIGLAAGSYAAEPPRIYATGSILRVVQHSNSSTIVCTPYTVSGASLTAGTSASVSADAFAVNRIRSFQLANGDICVTHVYSAYLVIGTFKLSGTTEMAYTNNLIIWESSYKTFERFCHILLPNNVVAVSAAQNDTSSSFMNVCTISSTPGFPTVSTTSIYPGLVGSIIPASSGFASTIALHNFDFASGASTFDGINYFSNSLPASKITQDRLSNSGGNILSNDKKSIVFNNIDATNALVGNSVMFDSKSAIDNPHKIKPPNMRFPNFAETNKSEVFAVNRAHTNFNYGISIQRVKLIDY